MDFYVILGLDRAASVGDIKRAYKRLARRYHPDINPGDRAAAAHFRAIAEAYETLSDPERRSRYDRGADAGSPGDAATFGFEGFDFSVTVGGASAPTFGDLFADVLHQREVRQRDEATRGVDLHDAITRARVQRREDALDHAGIVQEVLAEAFARCMHGLCLCSVRYAHVPDPAIRQQR